MLNIILSLDYEIFGDGAGDVKKHIITPTDRILTICDKYSVPLTIMFEVNEYQKFVEYDTELVNDFGYSPAQAMKGQVLKAFKNSHDVQLHIHPQWLHAKYDNKQWVIDDPNISITEFSIESINKIISGGKSVLENIAREIDSSFSLSVLRLTNLPWIEAPVEIHKTMVENKIYYHSLSTSDSLKNNKAGFWQLDFHEKLFEIPIHSVSMAGYRQLTWNRLKTAFYRRLFTRDSIKNYSSQQHNRFNKAPKMFFDCRASKWDFCKQSHKEMLDFLNEAMKRYNYKVQNVPVVMIGHSKDFLNDKNFNKFLSTVSEMISRNKFIKFSTFSQFCSTISNQNQHETFHFV